MFRSLTPNMNTLQFLSNYTNMLIRRYLRLEEINQKLLNPFRLALEVCISFQESYEGYLIESSKTLSLQRLLEYCLTDLNGVTEVFYVKFISEVLRSIEIIFSRIPSLQERVKVFEIIFNYCMKCRSYSDNVQIMISDNRTSHVANMGDKPIILVPQNNTVNFANSEEVNGKVPSPRKQKEEILNRIRIIMEVTLDSMFSIFEQEDFDAALVDYNNSLVYNFIVHVFNAISIANTRNGKGIPKEDDDEDQVQISKDPKKLEILGKKFLYNFVKRFKSTRMNEMIYNLFSTKYSLKVSLNELKNCVNLAEEKKAHKVSILCIF